MRANKGWRLSLNLTLEPMLRLAGRFALHTAEPDRQVVAGEPQALSPVEEAPAEPRFLCPHIPLLTPVNAFPAVFG